VRIAAVIPCYKVREHVVAVVEGALRHVNHVFVVDDCCPQGSGDVVRERFPSASVTVIAMRRTAVSWSHEDRLSCGAGGRYQILVKIDGDGQMDCDYIPALVQPVSTARRTTRRETAFTVGSTSR